MKTIYIQYNEFARSTELFIKHHSCDLRAAKTDEHTKKGWANSAYGTSKMCVTQATVIQQKELDSDPRTDLVLNCVSTQKSFTRSAE